MNQQASLRAGSKRRISFSQKHETEQDRATRKLIDLRMTQRMQNHIRSTARNSYTKSLLQSTNNITGRSSTMNQQGSLRAGSKHNHESTGVAASGVEAQS